MLNPCLALIDQELRPALPSPSAPHLTSWHPQLLSPWSWSPPHPPASWLLSLPHISHLLLCDGTPQTQRLEMNHLAAPGSVGQESGGARSSCACPRRKLGALSTLSWGTRWPHRKAGSVPVGDSLLPPHGHGITCTSQNLHAAAEAAWGLTRPPKMHRVPPEAPIITLGFLGHISRSEPTLAEKRGSERG